MDIRSIVAWIRSNNPERSPQQILEAVNLLHTEAMHSDLDSFLCIDPATGQPPFLQTKNLVYTYNAPANCRKTKGVFIHDRGHGYGWLWQNYGRPNDYLSYADAKPFHWKGRSYLMLPWVSQEDGLQDAGVLGTVTFGGHFNPGDTNNVYHHLYWTFCNPILTVNDQLQIPESLHRLFMNAVSASFAELQYGKTSNDTAVIDDFMTKFRNYKNRGTERDIRTRPSRELQDW